MHPYINLLMPISIPNSKTQSRPPREIFFSINEHKFRRYQMHQSTMMTLTPVPTRRRAVLIFQQPTTLFINREIIENDSFENDRGATNGWEVTRRIVSSVSCHRIATSITYKRRFLLRFFSRDGTTVKFDCSLHAPDTWYPRTVLMTLDA